ncbi:MAG TPA: hypothetical protein VE621_00970 [Bryobacteraceae bacterium]|nr:hypothetical protein [Bryobacteraceae bacterium]
MNSALVEEIANAVLYEGYVLYPYRASSVKNRQRWNFGVVYPSAYSSSQNGADACWMRTECVARSNSTTALSVKVRFLQLTKRLIGQFHAAHHELPEGPLPDFRLVDRLEVDDRILYAWQEAVERDVCVNAGSLSELARQSLRQTFEIPAHLEVEQVRDSRSLVVGVILRESRRAAGDVEIDAEPIADDLYRVGVTIRNLTPFESAQQTSRDEALLKSFVSTHTILCLEGGEFMSLLEPPEELVQVCAKCRNTGTWPVLAGEEGQRGVVLSSPVILYDYPRIAPESPGALFDGTEIDEILTLRILTMTDDEKREMREVDARTRQILERTEALLPEQLMKLHGEMR